MSVSGYDSFWTVPDAPTPTPAVQMHHLSASVCDEGRLDSQNELP